MTDRSVPGERVPGTPSGNIRRCMYCNEIVDATRPGEHGPVCSYFTAPAPVSDLEAAAPSTRREEIEEALGELVDNAAGREGHHVRYEAVYARVLSLVDGLAEDARRLDWLDGRTEVEYFGVGEHERWSVGFTAPRDIPTLREAIDAARNTGRTD